MRRVNLLHRDRSRRQIHPIQGILQLRQRPRRQHRPRYLSRSSHPAIRTHRPIIPTPPTRRHNLPPVRDSSELVPQPVKAPTVDTSWHNTSPPPNGVTPDGHPQETPPPPHPPSHPGRRSHTWRLCWSRPRHPRPPPQPPLTSVHVEGTRSRRQRSRRGEAGATDRRLAHRAQRWSTPRPHDHAVAGDQRAGSVANHRRPACHCSDRPTVLTPCRCLRVPTGWLLMLPMILCAPGRIRTCAPASGDRYNPDHARLWCLPVLFSLLSVSWVAVVSCGSLHEPLHARRQRTWWSGRRRSENYAFACRCGGRLGSCGRSLASAASQVSSVSLASSFTTRCAVVVALVRDEIVTLGLGVAASSWLGLGRRT
jgi:hypothetical protein